MRPPCSCWGRWLQRQLAPSPSLGCRNPPPKNTSATKCWTVYTVHAVHTVHTRNCRNCMHVLKRIGWLHGDYLALKDYLAYPRGNPLDILAYPHCHPPPYIADLVCQTTFHSYLTLLACRKWCCNNIIGDSPLGSSSVGVVGDNLW